MSHSSPTTVSEVYALALHDLAQQQELTQPLRQELCEVRQLLDDLQDFEAFLACPSIHREQKRGSLERIFAQRVSPLLYHFLLVLVGRDRLGYLRDIIRDYEMIDDHALGKVDGLLITAIELDDSQAETLAEKMGQKLGCQLRLQRRVDPSIIGGMQLIVDDQVYDSSVAGELSRFSRQLSQSLRRQLTLQNENNQ